MTRIRAVREGGEHEELPILWVGPEEIAANGAFAIVPDGEAFPGWADALVPQLSEMMGIEPPAARLTERVVDEWRESHAALGETPETWSPLGRTDVPAHALEQIAPRDDDDLELRAEQDEYGRTTVRWSSPALGWSSTTTYASAAVLAVIPPGTVGLELDLARLVETADPLVYGPLAGELLDLDLEEQGWGPREADEIAVQWRVYTGEGTRVVDGEELVDLADPWSPLTLDQGTRRARAGFVVARLVRRWLRGTFTAPTDPSLRYRTRRHAEAHPDVVTTCPEVSAATSLERAVVVVHGTMGCAIPLARAVREALDRSAPDLPVLRFEHDTWAPVTASAGDLAAALRSLGARSLLLVAHSRGGLVAKHAAQLVLDDVGHVEVLTLGTPFGGTPLVGAAERGRRVVVSLAVAVLRALGGPAADVATSAVLRSLRHQLPEGIRDMHLESSYLGLLRSVPLEHVTAVAGRTDPLGVGDSWGFGDGVFAGLYDGPNDRVVSVESASAARGSQVHEVESDHSSYAELAEVHDLVRQAAARL